MHGLPVVAHRHPVMEYVIGKEETLVDLTSPGSMAAALSAAMAGGNGTAGAASAGKACAIALVGRSWLATTSKCSRAVSYREIPVCR